MTPSPRREAIQTVLQKTIVVLLALASLLSAIRYWHSTINMERGKEALAAWEARVGPARQFLPVQRGVIGYVADWDVPGIPYSFEDQESEFLLSQYALAPLVLKRGATAEWNVAVLNPKSFAAWQAAFGGQFTVLDVGHRVYILHRVADP